MKTFEFVVPNEVTCRILVKAETEKEAKEKLERFEIEGETSEDNYQFDKAVLEDSWED